jgi:triacylglycerol lipase
MYFPPNFDLPRAIELARLVKQAYEQLDSFKKGQRWTLQGRYSLVRELIIESFATRSSRATASLFDRELMALPPAEGAHGRSLPIGFIAEDTENVYVALRGTMTITEWFRNLNVQLSDYIYPDHGKVHDGIIKAYGGMRQSLLEVLSSVNPRKELFLTGHSVGAALVTFASLDIMAKTPFKAPRVYTYGSPRVGDRDFVRAYNKALAARSFRIVNTSDAIVSLPLPGPIFGIVGGYFTEVETPVDFTAQNDDMEMNHVIETYLAGLIEAQRNQKTGRRMFKWRLTGG